MADTRGTSRRKRQPENDSGSGVKETNDMKILQTNDQTRRAVVAAYQAANVPIGWVLQGTSGLVYNPPNQYSLVPNVQSVLNAINPSTALMVLGNSGVAVTDNGITSPIFQSTINGQLSDDFVCASLLQGVTFVSGSVVQG